MMRHRESEGNCHYSGGLGSSTRATLDSLACESPAGFLEGGGNGLQSMRLAWGFSFLTWSPFSLGIGQKRERGQRSPGTKLQHRVCE